MNGAASRLGWTAGTRNRQELGVSVVSAVLSRGAMRSARVALPVAVTVVLAVALSVAIPVRAGGAVRGGRGVGAVGRGPVPGLMFGQVGRDVPGGILEPLVRVRGQVEAHMCQGGGKAGQELALCALGVGRYAGPGG